MKHGICLLSCSALAACAGISPITPAGSDTYLVAAHGVMGHSSEGEQRANAYAEASKYCQAMGKKFEPLQDSGTPSGFGKTASAEVRFRCS